ncbi:MAG: hypothetical protein H6698_08205 [Myxococcales bacterium]|nr:hypothetical protein [Myxococcales bacterium]MCB9520216.1 hypothetical protein [Myxococcales bacterium]MCB9531138.1 hypothetical protein [Myxococcales bacterium]MCB9534271.1 hypothetical protein [Myxococcales bacterium]
MDVRPRSLENRDHQGAGPLFQQTLPDLRGNVYLSSAGPDLEDVGAYLGSNLIMPDGGHSHTGVTGSAGRHKHDIRGARVQEKGGVALATGTPRKPHDHDMPSTGEHAHSIGPEGAHTHGTDKRPLSFVLTFIIRVA